MSMGYIVRSLMNTVSPAGTTCMNTLEEALSDYLGVDGPNESRLESLGSLSLRRTLLLVSTFRGDLWEAVGGRRGTSMLRGCPRLY